MRGQNVIPTKIEVERASLGKKKGAKYIEPPSKREVKTAEYSGIPLECLVNLWIKINNT